MLAASSNSRIGLDNPGQLLRGSSLTQRCEDAASTVKAGNAGRLLPASQRKERTPMPTETQRSAATRKPVGLAERPDSVGLSFLRETQPEGHNKS